MHLSQSDDGRYLLQTRDGQKLVLTPHELSEVATLAKNHVDQLKLVASRTAQLATSPVTDVVVGIDVHHTEVILRLRQSGIERAFTLHPQLASGIVSGVTKQLALIDAAKGRWTKQ